MSVCRLGNRWYGAEQTRDLRVHGGITFHRATVWDPQLPDSSARLCRHAGRTHGTGGIGGTDPGPVVLWLRLRALDGLSAGAGSARAWPPLAKDTGVWGGMTYVRAATVIASAGPGPATGCRGFGRHRCRSADLAGDLGGEHELKPPVQDRWLAAEFKLSSGSPQ